MPARILVSGVSGPLGAALLPSLRDGGYRVVRLVRGADSDDEQISSQPAKPWPGEADSGCEIVIHLAGESNVGRGAAALRPRLRDSRLLGTRSLPRAHAR